MHDSVSTTVYTDTLVLLNRRTAIIAIVPAAVCFPISLSNLLKLTLPQRKSHENQALSPFILVQRQSPRTKARKVRNAEHLISVSEVIEMEAMLVYRTFQVRTLAIYDGKVARYAIGAGNKDNEILVFGSSEG